MVVDIFIPCFIDQIYPETGMNMIKILEKIGLEVYYNPNQTCCGQTAYNNGFWDEAKAVGGKFIKDFPHNRPIIGPSASCIGFIKTYYDQLFFNSALHNEYLVLKRNMYEFTNFLVSVLKISDIGATFPYKVTYHDSCSALRQLKIKEEPRLLLKHVKGLELIEMEETDTCCGYGSSFTTKNEDISFALAERKVRNAIATGAEYIVSTDATCLMHMQGYIDKHALPIKTIHLIDVLASGWE
jgi:L-lactate dehydrogenase complex protein LldE